MQKYRLKTSLLKKALNIDVGIDMGIDVRAWIPNHLLACDPNLYELTGLF